MSGDVRLKTKSNDELASDQTILKTNITCTPAICEANTPGAQVQLSEDNISERSTKEEDVASNITLASTPAISEVNIRVGL